MSRKSDQEIFNKINSQINRTMQKMWRMQGWDATPEFLELFQNFVMLVDIRNATILSGDMKLYSKAFKAKSDLKEDA